MVYLKLFSLMALIFTTSTALSTPIQTSLNTTAVGAITPPHLAINTSLNTNLSEILTTHGRPVCTAHSRWRLPGDRGAGIYASACFMALREIENQEVISLTQYRFLSTRASGHFQQATIQTPKRYEYDLHGIDCTVVVAMLVDFRPDTGVLPRAPRGPFQRTVESDWLNIYEAAQNLYLLCFTGTPQFGYVTLRRQNLGVFIWATESVMNTYLPPYAGFEANSSTVETE